MKKMICGASGQVAKYLIKMYEKNTTEIVVTSRSKIVDNSKFKQITLDYFDSNLQAKIFNDINKILIIWPSNLIKYDIKFNNFLELVFNSNIEHITFISALGMEYSSKSPYTIIEKKIKKSGKDYTILRPNMYMQNIITHHINEIKNLQQLHIPAKNAQISYIDANDVAKIIKIIWDDSKNYKNKVLPLTGANALSNQEIVATINQICNLKISFKAVSSKEFKLIKENENMSSEIIKELANLYFIAKWGFMKKVYPQAKDILGANLSTFSSFVKNNLDKFQ